MDRIIYLNELYDLYNSLLTEKEKDCFLDYYSEDLSLSEIAENNSVSRNAIHKTVKTVEEKLEEYENKLNLRKVKLTLIDICSLNDINEIKAKLNSIF